MGMKNTQKGSTTVILSIIIILLILGFSIYIYQTRTNPNIEDSKKEEAKVFINDDSNKEITPTTNETGLELITYSGTTALGSNFSVRYPSTWVYYEFSCNVDGTAFWPRGIVPDFSKGSVCSMNSFLESAPIILNYTSRPELSLRDNGYQDEYNLMKASLKY